MGLFSKKSDNKWGSGVNFGREKQKQTFQTVSGTTETGWDSGPFAAVLQCLHLAKRLLELRNTKKLKITACMRSWGKL